LLYYAVPSRCLHVAPVFSPALDKHIILFPANHRIPEQINAHSGPRNGLLNSESTAAIVNNLENTTRPLPAAAAIIAGIRIVSHL